MKAALCKNALFLWCLLGCTLVKAFTASSFNNKKSYPKNHPSLRLLYTKHPNRLQDGFQHQSAAEESGHVARIRKCTSLDQVGKALIRAASQFGESPISPSTNISQLLPPNMAAAVLLKVAQLMSRQRNLKEDSASLMWSLVERLQNFAALPAAESPLTVYALVDTLSALAILKRKLKFGELPTTSELEDNSRIHGLATILVSRLDSEREELLRVLRPFRLVDILHALQVLGFDNQSPRATRIHMGLCQKLAGGHELSVLSAGDMSIALTTLAAVSQHFDSVESTLAVALMRRFRKQAVRQSATSRQLLQALRAVTDIGVQAKHLLTDSNEDSLIKYFKEAQIMVFTVFKSILQRHSPDQETDNLQLMDKIHQDDVLVLDQISEMLKCLSAMEVLERQSGDSNQTNNAALKSLWDSFLRTTSKYFLTGESQDALGHASVDEIARFLRAVEGTHSTDLALAPEFVEHLGYHFHVEALASLRCFDDGGVSIVNPHSVNTILRSAVLDWGHNDTVLWPFLECARELFITASFLASCTATDLTNFLTFLAKTKYNPGGLSYDGEVDSAKDALLAIAGRLMDDEVTETISPAQASRILSCFTAAVAERTCLYDVGSSEAHVNATQNLFHTLGGHLLTDNSDELSPRHISDALCAYAKASYVQDMGIFDHLASLLAARVDDCNIRQIAQSLWACGKMTIWEVQHREQLSDGGTDDSLLPPPYLPSANHFAHALSQHRDEMTTKDVSQAVWALARLQSLQSCDDDEPAACMDDFILRATTLAPHLTSQEVANILWGMSKVGYRYCDETVESFTHRLLHLHESTAEKSTPQEAANVMMALGRMQIKNEKVFEMLSNEMLDQLDVASAQSIANALGAHRAVHITPPRQLLDRWAIERLGLVAVQPRRQP